MSLYSRFSPWPDRQNHTTQRVYRQGTGVQFRFFPNGGHLAGATVTLMLEHFVYFLVFFFALISVIIGLYWE